MSKEIISTDQAPKAIGPYSQGVKAGGFLFLSGAIALDPATGEICPGGIAAETEQVMKNIAALLAASGLGFGDVVKTVIYLAQMGDFAAVNAIYGRFFPEEPPARVTVEVQGLPRGALVEIEITALCR
ncbi:MAG: reactive intermediate/imine deaminase [Geobacteraceae bacterium GWC2_58_44]|nr:MAG: reactive intermediate/imine deaminase [Geobacteraceae bacterium GWC2_58_44]HBG04640.1 reactive intermediate/imine deaminase [Geobacter sp.]